MPFDLSHIARTYPEWLIAGGFFVALAASLAFTPWIRGVANRRHWTDAPDRDRKIHTRHVPRVGGIAIVIAFLAGLAYFTLVEAWIPEAYVLPSWFVVGGALFIAAIGFLDDLFGLHFSHKFTAQVVVGIFLICGGYRFEVLPASLTATPLDLGWWATGVLTVLWVAGITNAVNLLDGMDGLAAGVALIALAALTGVQVLAGDLTGVLLASIFAAALIGFLVFNFNPASIFMGDTGSFFIGFLLAVIALPGEPVRASWIALAVPVVALGVPVADTAVTIVRRYVTGRPVFFPDQDHIHHRMVNVRGLSHRRAVLVLYAASALLGGLAVLLSRAESPYVIALFLAVMVCLASGFLYWLGYLRVRDVLSLLRNRNGARAARSGLPDRSANGHVNGHVNGHSNGHARANGASVPVVNGYRHAAGETRTRHHVGSPAEREH